MPRYRKLPVEIEATQWLKNGDHPNDNCKEIMTMATFTDTFMSEGKVVRRFRSPNTGEDKQCEKCGNDMHWHGWIDTLEGGHIVCPGDFIITGVQGEHYPCKPDIFAKTYELVE